MPTTGRQRQHYSVCLIRVRARALLGISLILATTAHAQMSFTLAQAPAVEEPPQDAGPPDADTPPEESGFELAGDAVLIRQSVDVFSSLDDAQPSLPGRFEVLLEVGWRTQSGQSDLALLKPELQYTPGGGAFLDNLQLTLGWPVELGDGGIDGNGDMLFGWQQRWHSDDGTIPTLGTLFELRVPSGYQSSGVDGTLTGIVAKDLGPGTAYFNGFLTSANGDNVEDIRHFQWGVRVGYQWQMTDTLSFVGTYIHQSSEQRGHSDINVLELGGRYDVGDGFTIGPGVQIGLDDNEETPNFAAGVRMMIPLN